MLGDLPHVIPGLKHIRVWMLGRRPLARRHREGINVRGRRLGAAAFVRTRNRQCYFGHYRLSEATVAAQSG